MQTIIAQGTAWAALAASVVFVATHLAQPRASANAESAAATTEITADFARPLKVKQSMTGFLLGDQGGIPPENVIAPLHVGTWRYGYPHVFPKRLIDSGAQLNYGFSDGWRYKPDDMPFDDYSRFDAFVTKAAHAAVPTDVDWDVWNEPDNVPYFWSGTREELFETYRHAYQVLRTTLGPAATIGSPSFAHFDREYLDAYFDYCLAQHLEVNVLHWHEMTDDNIALVTAHLNEARAAYIDNPKYQSIKLKKLSVNEYCGPKAQYWPGEALNYLAALERGGADGACKSCWAGLHGGPDNCENGSLDGLLDPLTKDPRANWWAYKLYSNSINGRVEAACSDPAIAAFASRSSSSAAALLIGLDSNQNSQGAKHLTINLQHLDRIAHLRGHETVQVSVRSIPASQEAVVTELPIVLQLQVPVTNGTATFKIPDLPVHEAVQVTVE